MLWKPQSVFENMLFTTIRVETDSGMGTGFFFDVSGKDKHNPFVVTNKHVIAGAQRITVMMHKGNGENAELGAAFQTAVSASVPPWILHPDIDIAALPIAPILNSLNANGKEVFFRVIEEKLIPSAKAFEEEVDAVEDIVFVGYPNDIYDTKNFLPVVRRGITATAPWVDFQGSPTFLIDAPVFPGSSGSPVLMFSRGVYYRKGGLAGIGGGTRVQFLGVLSGAFFRETPGRLEWIDLPVLKQPVPCTREHLDLGIVYNSWTIQNFLKDVVAEWSSRSEKQ